MSRVLELTASSLATLDSEVRELLDFLPVLYPGGEQWLERALNEVRSGEADGFEVRDNGELVGIVLGQLKPSGKYKLRTLFVAEQHRNNGIGRALLRAGIEAAENAGASAAYITFAHTITDEIKPLLDSERFEHLAYAPDRYGIGRDEIVSQRAL